MDRETIQALHDVLDHHGKIRAEHLERFERGVTVNALAALVQHEAAAAQHDAACIANELSSSFDPRASEAAVALRGMLQERGVLT